MNGEPIRPCPKLMKVEREPRRLQHMSAKRAARIAAGEERHGMKRSFMVPKAPRRLSHPDYDAGREEYARRQMCVGLAAFPAHVCVGVNEASHERNPQGGMPTGTGRKEPSRLTVPKCSQLHRDWTRTEGPFEGWPNDARHEWMLARTDETNVGWDALPTEQKDWYRGQAGIRKAQYREAMRGLG